MHINLPVTVSCLKLRLSFIVHAGCVPGDIGSLSTTTSVSRGSGEENECFEGGVFQEASGDQRN